MAANPPSPQDLLYLYCLEQAEEQHEPIVCSSEQDSSSSLVWCWEDDELSALFSREESTGTLYRELESSPHLANARREAVDWILAVNSYYSFASLTAVLAVNYLDRFLLCFHLQADKPWMTQLAAVACLSVAAKVEETRVPLLLDLQVGESSRYVFEPKTIQRMEILILSALKWRMNPVTPLSFLDYMARRLGMKNHLCRCEFVAQCERIIVSVISDSRSLLHSPSIIAAAAMLHAINGVEPSVRDEYQEQLLGILGIHEEKMSSCSELIMELVSFRRYNNGGQWRKRRKLDSIPGSPNGVMDLSFSSDCSADSAASSSSSVSSSPREKNRKKNRVVAEQRFLSMIVPP